MSYDSLTNRGDYLSPHYLAEVLPRELAKKEGLRAQWAQRDKEGNPSPVRELRTLKRGYFAARPDLADFAQRVASGDPVTEDERRTHNKAVKKQNDDVLHALGFAAARGVMDAGRSGETFGVPVAYQGQNVVAVDCGWAADTDAALDPDRAGRLLDPLSHPGDWSEVILKGIQLGVATPMFKSPVAGSNDVLGWNLVDMPADATPETEYRRATDLSTYEAAQDLWVDQRSNRFRRRYTEFYRLAWRRQIASDTERSLYAAIIPPGPTHVDLVHTLAMPDHRMTALASGFWASLPLDYFVRITGKGDLRIGGVKALPFGSVDHPLASALLLRTMRLNCLTTAYADLWADVYNYAWCDDTWACSWESLPPLGEVGPTWGRDTPLRTEQARRSALVEIDALVAVWLGMDVDALIAIYQASFPVLNRYEEITWFDANGWKLAGYHRTYGQIQQKGSYDEFLAYNEDPARNPSPDGYTPPFHKADRVAEYRQAHAVFSERLRKAQGGG